MSPACVPYCGTVYNGASARLALVRRHGIAPVDWIPLSGTVVQSTGAIPSQFVPRPDVASLRIKF